MLKLFLQEGGAVEAFEIDCYIKPRVGFDRVDESLSEHLLKDIDLFAAANIIAKADDVEAQRGKTWLVKNYFFIKQRFELRKKIYRIKLYSRITHILFLHFYHLC